LGCYFQKLASSPGEKMHKQQNEKKHTYTDIKRTSTHRHIKKGRERQRQRDGGREIWVSYWAAILSDLWHPILWISLLLFAVPCVCVSVSAWLCVCDFECLCVFVAMCVSVCEGVSVCVCVSMGVFVAMCVFVSVWELFQWVACMWVCLWVLSWSTQMNWEFVSLI